MVIYLFVVIAFANLFLQIFLKGSLHYFVMSKLHPDEKLFIGGFGLFIFTYKFLLYPEIVMPRINKNSVARLDDKLKKELLFRTKIYKFSLMIFILLLIVYGFLVVGF